MPAPQPGRAIVALAFPSPTRAKQALRTALELHEQGDLAVHDAVLVFRPTDAKATVQETRDPTPIDLAIPTGALGALIGTLIAGPLGLLAGAAIAATAGALVAKLIDTGIPDRVVIQLRELTGPGDTVLALLVGDVHGDAALAALHRFRGARVLYATLPPHALELVRRALTPARRRAPA